MITHYAAKLVEIQQDMVKAGCEKSRIQSGLRNINNRLQRVHKDINKANNGIKNMDGKVDQLLAFHTGSSTDKSDKERMLEMRAQKQRLEAAMNATRERMLRDAEADRVQKLISKFEGLDHSKQVKVVMDMIEGGVEYPLSPFLAWVETNANDVFDLAVKVMLNRTSSVLSAALTAEQDAFMKLKLNNAAKVKKFQDLIMEHGPSTPFLNWAKTKWPTLYEQALDKATAEVDLNHA